MDEDTSKDDQAAASAAVPLADLLGQAVAIHRRATGQEDYEAIWPILDEAAALGRAAFGAALELLGSKEASARAVACDLLGALCNPDERVLGPEVTLALVRLAEHEDDPDVVWSIARALGSAEDHMGLSTLVSLVGHPDSDVRYQVALALPFCQEGGDAAVLAGALMTLMEDSDEQIRDWATFGLGSLTEIDGDEVREALLGRLDDAFPDAREEAILGLARRRDRRVFPVVERELRDDEVGRMQVEAAAYLADVRLLGPLRALQSWWDLDAGLLEEAIAACDPEQRATALELQSTFLALLEGRLADLPEVSASLSCERLEGSVTLFVERDGEIECYFFEGLLAQRAGGDVEAAVEVVLADLRGGWPA